MKLCKECLASLDAEIASLSADLTVLEKLRNQYQEEILRRLEDAWERDNYSEALADLFAGSEARLPKDEVKCKTCNDQRWLTAENKPCPKCNGPFGMPKSPEAKPEAAPTDIEARLPEDACPGAHELDKHDRKVS